MPSTATRVLISGRGRKAERRQNRNDGSMRKTLLDIAGFAESNVRLEPSNVGDLQKLEKVRKWIFRSRPQRGGQPCRPLDLAP